MVPMERRERMVQMEGMALQVLTLNPKPCI